jgi:SAM-dependent methyltransferase
MRIAATRIGHCRSCGGLLGTTFCALGSTPLANSYLAPGDERDEQRFPLRALVCDDCRLVQLDTIVDPAGIFSHYAYFSSASTSWVGHALGFAQHAAQEFGLSARSWVVEAASNDGYLLRHFAAAGVPCLGVEPAANVAAVAQAAGVPTRVAFLDRAFADALVCEQGRHADLVVANNVLAHVPDVNNFVDALARLAGPSGIVSMEVPYLVRLVEGNQFDTIYHEHYAYWSLYSLEPLLARHGLHVADVHELSTHGGSLRVYASARRTPATPAVDRLRALEARLGLDRAAFYTGFDERVRGVLSGFRSWLEDALISGRRVAAYGAAAKGNTFLNAAGVRHGQIGAVADRSPAKQGRLLPGTHVPVLSPEQLLSLEPDDILVLPWNLLDEVRTFLRGEGYGGRIVTAVPEVRCH